ncbi:MAG: 4-hydroxythreonine-4-phosphate dehydrogenase PdxA [Gammaproteobacteria bacterium RIFCSPHIGHO2_02_FULL_39_13]|nr:MAG: 4-hydroxythreonine-4-phosphate dehydrogenase PdxA [Gammaproteobacteria bacterium RIFCSPHIGHO2_02_FULL_39_13]OGT50576.1 MAG: 4-hydroxythreonine-4-phosphate dehydrogenase PdxA [Gammaproteobacteria bacterium RIFCSPHIGHO2_12_FULL_39_24]
MDKNDSRNSVHQNKLIALTLGEPAGIGPDIIVQLYAQQPEFFVNEEIIIIGNKKLLCERAKKIGVSCNVDQLNIIDILLPESVIPGQLNKNNARFVIDMLTTATQLALQKKVCGIVTAPIHKGIINDAGFAFKGHTDFFARYTQCKTVMMLMTDALKVALLTDHVPLCDVPNLITKKNIADCLDIIIHDFQHKLTINNPRILMCGLNPHAGENGYLGSEEKEIITPVIEKYQRAGHRIMGPIGADVAFTEKYRDQADVILSLYHDQGLPVIKYAGFSDAINVTLGLPFLRTSVDHGTALDIAGTGKADVTSLRNAIMYIYNRTAHEVSG